MDDVGVFAGHVEEEFPGCGIASTEQIREYVEN